MFKNLQLPWNRKPKPRDDEEPEVVDADEIEAEEDNEIEGERGLPSVNKSKTIHGRITQIIVMAALGAFILFALARHYINLYKEHEKNKGEQAQTAAKTGENKATNTIPFPNIPPPDTAPAEAAASGVAASSVGGAGMAGGGQPGGIQGRMSGYGMQGAGAGQTPVPDLVNTGNEGQYGYSQPGMKRNMTPEEEVADDRLKSKPGTMGGATGGAGAVRPVAYVPSGDNPVDEKADALQGMYTPTAKAQVLADRNLMVAKGAFLDGSLDTELDSTLGGYAQCTLSRDVYSDNGRVVLMEKGTTCSGEYRGDMKPGQARLFVLWTRCKTPRGVVVDLASTGTDRLGRAGVDGYVDNHFWDRFGAAIMTSIVLQTATAVQNRANRGNGNQINLNQPNSPIQDTQGLVMEMVKPQADLPATLFKHRGERISIYLARDLDFRPVYRLDKVDY